MKDEMAQSNIGPSYGIEGNNSTMARASIGPINPDSDVDEFSNPAADARSSFLFSMDLSDPTNRFAHERPSNTWVARNMGYDPTIMKESVAIDVNIRPIPMDFLGGMRSIRKYMAKNWVIAFVASTVPI